MWIAPAGASAITMMPLWHWLPPTSPLSVSPNSLVALGISDRRAREMDHLPVSGADGSLSRLAGLTRPVIVYTHINNTNPMLLEDSPEREAVERAGLQVGADGTSFTI